MKRIDMHSDLQCGTLISMGQLCDDGCTALFNQEEATVVKLSPMERLLIQEIIQKSQQVLHGNHNKDNGMRYTNFSMPNANNATAQGTMQNSVIISMR
eukprot:11746814-Ditylum_brightwellii.AAC.1